MLHICFDPINISISMIHYVRCECTVPLSASSSATLVYATTTLQRHRQYSGNVAAAAARRAAAAVYSATAWLTILRLTQ